MPKTIPGEPIITADELRRLFSYDPATGVFVRGAAGEPAGTLNRRGRRCITIRYRSFYAHRLAWLYVHGRWPSQIDHINCDPADNRLVNLREATTSQNHANVVLGRVPKSGTRGVYRNGPSFSARLSIEGKQVHLGSFSTTEEAEAAYRVAKLRRHGEYARFE